MEFKDHLQILRACRIYRGNITKGTLIRQILEIAIDHRKDFDDINDFFSKLYPDRVIQRVGAGVNIHHRRRRPRREPAFYDTPIQHLEEEAEE